MGWDKFGLLGHSMGAGMSSLYAATFPEHVQVINSHDCFMQIIVCIAGAHHVGPGEAHQQEGR